MTARDLVERRTTDSLGNTKWRVSRVVQAALDGSFVVLDGVNRLSTDSLSVLSSLIRDRELHLPDGRRLIRHDRYDALLMSTSRSAADMKAAGVLRVHPNFRLAALSITPDRENPLDSEFISLFPYIEEVKPLSIEEKMSVVTHKTDMSALDAMLAAAIEVYSKELERTSCNSSGLCRDDQSNVPSQLRPTLRQLKRLWKSIRSSKKFISNDEEMHQLLQSKFRSMFLVDFMPETLRTAISAALSRAEAMVTDRQTAADHEIFSCEHIPMGNASLDSSSQVIIGNVSLSRVSTLRPELVPNTHFITVPAHAQY